MISDITEDLVDRLDSLGMSRTDLAQNMGVSAAMVTKLLRGQNNFTVRTLVQIADALDCNVSVKLPPCGFSVVPFFVSEDSTNETHFVGGRKSEHTFTVDLHDADCGEELWSLVEAVA